MKELEREVTLSHRTLAYTSQKNEISIGSTYFGQLRHHLIKNCRDDGDGPR
jgi:hypothetical protein